MNKNQIIPIIILLILIGAVLSIYLSSEEKVNSNPYVMFEVSNEFDDSRTFTVMLNEKGYENENGDWATLQLSPSYSFGVRFTNVSIPKNARLSIESQQKLGLLDFA